MTDSESNAPSSAGADELVELAAVMRGHALQGELVLKLFNRESDLLSRVDTVVLRAAGGEQRTYQLASVRGAGDSVLIALRGVSTRDEADALRGSVVCIERAQLPPIEEGEYYLVDLPGLAVRSVDGATIGHVESVIAYPSIECLQVITAGIVREVPDLPRYLPEVHVRDGYVVVDHLDEIEPVPLAALKGKR
jgi:16S rRNA processing protein RimM